MTLEEFNTRLFGKEDGISAREAIHVVDQARKHNLELKNNITGLCRVREVTNVNDCI